MKPWKCLVGPRIAKNSRIWPLKCYFSHRVTKTIVHPYYFRTANPFAYDIALLKNGFTLIYILWKPNCHMFVNFRFQKKPRKTCKASNIKSIYSISCFTINLCPNWNHLSNKWLGKYNELLGWLRRVFHRILRSGFSLVKPTGSSILNYKILSKTNSRPWICQFLMIQSVSGKNPSQNTCISMIRTQWCVLVIWKVEKILVTGTPVVRWSVMASYKDL